MIHSLGAFRCQRRHAFANVPQVLTDWGSAHLDFATDPEEREQRLAMIDAAIDAFLDPARFDELARKRSRKESVPPIPYAANKDMTLAIENCLRAVGCDFKYFLPSRRLAPLAPSEVRFFLHGAGLKRWRLHAASECDLGPKHSADTDRDSQADQGWPSPSPGASPRPR